MTPSTLSVREVEFHERDVVLRQPFKFGVITLRECPQVFVHVRVELPSGESVWGWAAEMLLPKWFDKDPELSNDDNVDQLRHALALAREAYLAESRMLSPFALHAAYDGELIARGAAEHLNPLVVGFGNALLDRAVLDAVCTYSACSFFAAVQANLPGITSATAPDLDDFAIDTFLARRVPQPAIAARHTVGLVDAITDSDLTPGDEVHDGLPQSLEACAKFYGCTHFKLKVRGDIEADLERLRRIAAVLDARETPYIASLDGNEQYKHVDDVVALWERIAATPALGRLAAAILFIEQPITRKVAFETPIAALARCKPVEIDESDASIDAFPQAKALGYTGVSSKSCKGVYRSLLNRMRSEMWNACEKCDRYFMSGEDLVVQAGVALQQDLCLATTIGCTHLERNGHHYVNGLDSYSAAEQDAFLAAYPRMYHRQDGVVRLHIQNGLIDIRDLDQPGYGTSATPVFG
jgi:hypothetical protein